MSDQERLETSRMPWTGQRVCIRCRKVDFGIDADGLCRSCAGGERTYPLSDAAWFTLEQQKAVAEIAAANERLAEQKLSRAERRAKERERAKQRP